MSFQKKLRSTSAWVLYCKFAADLQNTFLKEYVWGTASVFYITCFGPSNTFYWLASIIYRPELVHWSKTFWRFSLFYDIFFEIISQLLAVTEAPIIFLFQSLVQQMFVVIAEAVPHRCSSKKIIWSILVINVNRNNFINREIFLFYTF